MIALQTPVTVRVIDAERPRVVWAPGVIVGRAYTMPPQYDVRLHLTGETLRNVSAENIERAP